MKLVTLNEQYHNSLIVEKINETQIAQLAKYLDQIDKQIDNVDLPYLDQVVDQVRDELADLLEKEGTLRGKFSDMMGRDKTLLAKAWNVTLQVGNMLKNIKNVSALLGKSLRQRASQLDPNKSAMEALSDIDPKASQRMMNILQKLLNPSQLKGKLVVDPQQAANDIMQLPFGQFASFLQMDLPLKKKQKPDTESDDQYKKFLGDLEASKRKRDGQKPPSKEFLFKGLQ